MRELSFQEVGQIYGGYAVGASDTSYGVEAAALQTSPGLPELAFPWAALSAVQRPNGSDPLALS